MSISIPVMDYEFHTDISSASIFIDRLAAFATACGWTVVEKQKSKQWAWVGGYGWTADAAVYPGHFLMLQNAYNRQFRLRVYPASAGIETHYMTKRGYTTGNTYSTGDSTHPAEQTTNAWTSTAWLNPIPTGNYIKTWFFGNSEALYWVIQFDADFSLTDGMGRICVFDSSSMDYGFLGRTAVTTSSGTTTIASIKASLYHLSCNIAASIQIGIYGIAGDHYYKRYLTTGYASANCLVFTNLMRRLGNYLVDEGENCIQGLFVPNLSAIQNVSSSRIPIWRQEFIYKDSLDNQWFLAGFSHMVHFQNEQGNAIGFKLESGTEQYLCFPAKNRYIDFAWHGFRIA